MIDTTMLNCYLNKLDIENFRGIKRLQVNWESDVNVIIGNNGSGKSSIIMALSLALSRFTGRIRSLNSNGIAIEDSWIHNGTHQTIIQSEMTISISDSPQTVTWTIGKKRLGGSQNITDLQQLNGFIKQLWEKLETDANTALPVVVCYGVDRNVPDTSLAINTKANYEQLVALDGAINKGNHTDFQQFFEWFRNREDLENESLRDNGQVKPDKQLTAVRKAIETMLPGFSGLKVRRQPLQLVVNKQCGDTMEQLDVCQLSDGEKCLLAMTGDLARRLAIANPASDNPLQGSGIVLIDEVDLHLHPQWEAVIVERLHNTFPHCQFIVTTHSPLVVGTLPPQKLWMITSEDNAIRLVHPQVARGLTNDEVLKLLMNTASLPEDIQKDYDNLYQAIEDGNWQVADEIVSHLQELSTHDTPELTKAKAYLALNRTDLETAK